MVGRILYNRVRCKKCGDVIESTSVHDYVECSCGAVAVDGGNEYLRRTFHNKDCFEELSVYDAAETDGEGTSS